MSERNPTQFFFLKLTKGVYLPSLENLKIGRLRAHWEQFLWIQPLSRYLWALLLVLYSGTCFPLGTNPLPSPCAFGLLQIPREYWELLFLAQSPSCARPSAMNCKREREYFLKGNGNGVSRRGIGW